MSPITAVRRAIRAVQAYRRPRRELAALLDEGFHGDRHLLRLVAWLAGHAHAFIETGANVGSTARYVARTFADLPVYSCESDARACAEAQKNVASLANAQIVHRESPAFLYELHERHVELCRHRNLYWLDAHGYGYRWPLVDEVGFLTSRLDSALILIDDFRVPGRPEFQYDTYADQVCCFETIAPALRRNRTYTLVYPDYSEHTSAHHPRVGVGLIVFGSDDLVMPDALCRHFRCETIAT
jgi:hypothetical protein